jgi:hypothetical protein
MTFKKYCLSRVILLTKEEEGEEEQQQQQTQYISVRLQATLFGMQARVFGIQ